MLLLDIHLNLFPAVAWVHKKNISVLQQIPMQREPAPNN